MEKIGRNDLCPCGSGKKFKKCHMGREEELRRDDPGEFSLEEMGSLITALRPVAYGRSREMAEALDIQGLTKRAMGIRFVDLHEYGDLKLSGSSRREVPEEKGGGLFINPYKTLGADPDHLYLALSKDVEDSELVHELAHVLDYLGGSRIVPGTMEPLSFETGVPVDHLEHPEEFGSWLNYLSETFDVLPDADDAIISYLYRNGMLIKGKDIQGRNAFILKSKSDRILKFLSEKGDEIDGMIRNLKGYIGPRRPGD